MWILFFFFAYYDLSLSFFSLTALSLSLSLHLSLSLLLPLLLQVVNKPDSHGGSLDWTKICEKSSKVITFIDLAGHEKYLKTTVFGMTGHLPDFCMLMVRGRSVCVRVCQVCLFALSG